MRSTPGFMRFVVLVLSISLVTLSGGCRDSDSDDDGGGDAAALCIGDWVQVNFLGTDEDGNVEEWDDDSTDPEGIGFVASISATEWAERDEYGYGEEVVFSYTINGDRFVKSIGGYTDTGRLEFPDENTMIEWWDYPAGAPEELIAFKWKRQ